MFKTLTVRTRNCRGTRYRFTPCSMGQIVQLVRSASQYVRCSFSLGLLPSSKDILDKNTPIIVGAQTSWSVAMRATNVLDGLAKEMWFCKNWNHLVAKGPNTAVRIRWAWEKLGKLKQLRWPYHHRKVPFALCESYHDWKCLFVRLLAAPVHLRQQIDTFGDSQQGVLKKDIISNEICPTAVVKLCVNTGRCRRLFRYLHLLVARNAIMSRDTHASWTFWDFSTQSERILAKLASNSWILSSIMKELKTNLFPL